MTEMEMLYDLIVEIETTLNYDHEIRFSEAFIVARNYLTQEINHDRA